MAVQNIECQISTVLMKRFLDGDNLPQNLLDDLERHLKVCSACQAILNNETNDIEEVLEAKVPAAGFSAMFAKKGLQPATVGGFVTAGAGQALMNASYRTQVPTAPGLAALKNPKVVFLSIALAVVLIVMSTLLKNPTNLLGPKATKAAAGYTEGKDEPKGTSHDESKAEDAPNGEAAADGHAGDTKSDLTHESDDAHTSDEHPTEAHGDKKETQPELIADPRVPGVPTLDQSDLIIAGGKKEEPAHKEETSNKTTTTSNHKTAPARSTTTTKSTPKRSTTTPKKRTTTSKKATTPPKSTGSGGIKVYDENGKPVKN